MALLKRLLLLVAIATAGVASTPATAAAQWYKPWKWLTKPSTPTLPSAPRLPSTPSLPSSPSPSGAADAAGRALRDQATDANSAPSVAGMTAQQREDLRMLVTRAKQRDRECDPSVTCAQERLDLWKEVQIADPTNVEARLNYDAANRDLAAARARDEKTSTRDASETQDRIMRLRDAERSLNNRDFDAAELIVSDVLRARPDDERAKSIQGMIDLKRERRRTLFLIAVISVVALLLLAGLVWLTVIAVRKHRAAKQHGETVAVSRQATLQVVDGVGRGRSAGIAGDVFRIGATVGDEGTRNDLVLSDADARISRFHCNVSRRDGRFYLTDTSSHGTTVNGAMLRRGEPKRLASGDTVVLAESAAILFTVH